MMKNSLIALFALTMVVGCGKSPDPNITNAPNNTVVNPTCTAPGTVMAYGQCVPAQNIISNCGYYGQQTAINGVPVCRYTVSMSEVFSQQGNSFNYYQLRLDPSAPAVGGYQVSDLYTGWPMVVRKGDLIELQGSGTWSNKTSWFSFNVFWGSRSYAGCKDGIDQDGRLNGVVQTHGVNGQPKGLFASDGYEAFMVGTGVTKTINNDGALRVGFNSDSDLVCAGIGLKIKITRCMAMDGTNRTFTCQ